jgi:arylsulfatase A-like enzyme
MQDFPRNRPGIHLESPFYCHVDTGSESSEADLSLADRPNTILVTTSVHGPAGPGSAQEDSVHVPLSMRWTGGNPSYQDLDGLFSHVDLAPTLLGFCGLTPPPGLQGHDRSRYILHRDGMPPESVFAYGRLGTKEEWAMIVRGLDKLVVNHAMETTHLFNLGLDPSEQSNLAEDPAQERTRDELNAHLREWMRRIAYRMDPSGLRIRP